MSDSCGERLWESRIQWNLVITVIPIPALQIAHARHVSNSLLALLRKDIMCDKLVRAGYIQIGLRSMHNLLLSILHPGLAWGGVCRL